jgi:hypothetical protein
VEEKRTDLPTTEYFTDSGEEDTEENLETIDFKELFRRAKENFKIEHLLICILIFLILLAIADRINVVNNCNAYWIKIVEEQTKSLYTGLP